MESLNREANQTDPIKTDCLCEKPNNREKLLKCAMEMFHQRGYGATSVDDILRESGVAKSNFYYHFRTKDDLAMAALEAHFAAHREKSRLLLQNWAEPPLTRLSLYFETSLRGSVAAHNAGCPFGNFAASLICETQLSSLEREKQERFRRSLARFFEQMEAELADCIREGKERGDIRNDLSESALATLTLATMQGMMVLAKTRTDHEFLTQGLTALRKILEK